MAKDIKDVERISLEDYIVGGNDKRSWYYAERDLWLATRVAKPEKYESYGYAVFMTALSLIGCAITTIIVLANGYGLSKGAVGTFSSFFLFGALHALWIKYLRRKERNRVAAIPGARREWKERLLTLIRRVEGFNGRLSAFKLYATHAEPGQEVDPAVVEKYDAERIELLAFKRQLLREQALAEFEEASANDDTGYRETRDLSDAIFMTKVRIEGTDCATMDVCAPNDEDRFRELEKSERQAAESPTEPMADERESTA